MPRKLKTYITNLGFFELALAAPSMKAALEAWGMGHNAFHQGFARETDDSKIVAAAMAKPGVVLKRPVGSKGAFEENAELPKGWAPPNIEPPKPSNSEAVGRKKRPSSPASRKSGKAKSKAASKSKTDDRDRAAIISFEKEKARRDREREKEAQRQEARKEKERATREREAEKARAALKRAESEHEDAMAALEKERDKLERRIQIERDRWDEEREKLKAVLRAAGG